MNGGSRGKMTCYAGKCFYYIDSQGRGFPCSRLSLIKEGISLRSAEGIRESWDTGEINCDFCSCNLLIELNLLLNFSPSSWFNRLFIKGI